MGSRAPRQKKQPPAEPQFVVTKVEDGKEEQDPAGIVYAGIDQDEAVNAFLQLLHEETEADQAPHPHADVAFTEHRDAQLPIVVAAIHGGPRFAAIRGISLKQWKAVAPEGVTPS